MAFSGQDAQKVFSKIKKMLEGIDANPAIQASASAAFKGLKEVLATQGGNPQLQLLPFSEADADVAGGTVLLSGACRVYAVFVRKNTSGTDNWFWLINDATNDGTDADHMIALALLEASKSAFAIYPAGVPFDTGVVVTQYGTDPIGKVDGSEGGDGFVLIGAA